MEYGTLAAGRVGNECGHVNMGYCVINRVRKAYGNVEYGILAAGSVGIACGHEILGFVYWESVIYKGTHFPVTTFHIYPIYKLPLSQVVAYV